MNTTVQRAPWFDDHTLFTLRSPAGVEVQVGSWGATLVSVKAPDRAGAPGELVLGFESALGWRENAPYFGSTVGRYANRIGEGRFTLDGRSYRLPTNLGAHHLHGGTPGFSHRPWQAYVLEEDSQGQGVEFRLHSVAGDQGYPGALDATVTYRLDPHGRLSMAYRAVSDAPTHVNLTNHGYWNLSGHDGPAEALPTVDDHILRLHASRYTVTDGELIPTGEIAAVAGTSLDFTGGRRLGAPGPDGGPVSLDHNFVMDHWDGTLRPCAHLYDPSSGRTLAVHTTCPGVQVYTPDFEGGAPGARGGGAYRGRQAVCLETQFYPDTPNRPEFPSTRLDPGDVWEHATVLEFGTA